MIINHYDFGLLDFEAEQSEFMPTPAEIAAACAAIQSTWGPAERRQRYQGLRRQAWSPPLVSTPAGVHELIEGAA